MEQVIIWAMVLMLCIFGVGLLSAIKSRRRRAPEMPIVVREPVEKKEKNPNAENELTVKIAASGYGNIAGGNAASQASGR